MGSSDSVTDRVQRAVDQLKPVDPYALFPELNEDIDRRISHSEQRIKYWVIFGVLVNFVALTMAAVPAVFFMGQVSQSASTIAASVSKQDTRFDGVQAEMTRQFIWRNAANQWMGSKGFVPPPEAIGNR